MCCLFECVVCLFLLFAFTCCSHISCLLFFLFSLRSYGTTDGVSRVDDLGAKVENVSFLCIWMTCTYIPARYRIHYCVYIHTSGIGIGATGATLDAPFLSAAPVFF